MYKLLKEESKPNLKKKKKSICFHTSSYLGYWKTVTPTYLQKHTTAEVTCHSWKAYGIPFISLSGMLCNAVIPTAKYHHRVHTLIKHIVLLGYLQLQQPWKGWETGGGKNIHMSVLFRSHIWWISCVWHVNFQQKVAYFTLAVMLSTLFFLCLLKNCLKILLLIRQTKRDTGNQRAFIEILISRALRCHAQVQRLRKMVKSDLSLETQKILDLASQWWTSC